MSSRLRRYGFILGLWTIYGVVIAAFVHYRSFLFPKGYMSWGSSLTSEVAYAYLWFAVTGPILMMAERFPLTGRRWLAHFPLHLAFSLILGLVTKAAWILLIAPRLYTDWQSTSLTTRGVVSSLDFGMMNYFLVLLCFHMVDYYVRLEQSRLRTVQLEAQLARAQLQALKMQLHPHFLFNTLHAISELVHEDPFAAERMIVKLSDFLRLTIDHAGVPEVTLREEMDFLARYLEIEKMRFEDRLQVEFNLDRNTLDARVPNLILQPLVENALKHGLGRRREAGVLRIAAQRADGLLSMQVFDNGPGFDPVVKPLRQGVGLSNTRERLERLYNGKHLFALTNVASGGFEVTIQIPFRLKSEP
ncbi:MAG: histidine kinase [Bryobacteraceae bacterium]